MIKYAEVAKKVLDSQKDIKLRPYFAVYEELFFILNNLIRKGLKIDTALVYKDVF